MADRRKNTQSTSHRGNRLLYVVAFLLAAGAVLAAGRLFLSGDLFGLQTATHSAVFASGAASGTLSQSSASAVSEADGAVSSSRQSASSAASAAVSSAPVPSSSATQSSQSAASLSGRVMLGDAFTVGLGIYAGVPSASLLAGNGLTTAAAAGGTVTVSGSRLSYAQAAAAKNPAQIYILLGSNDVSWMSAQSYGAYYGKLLDALQAACPGAQIYVQSVFPVKTGYVTGQGASITNEKIDAYNAALQTLCAAKKVKYLDAASALKAGDGSLQASLSGDGFHLNKSGYTRWMDYLANHT